MITNAPLKQCSVCSQYKERSEFYSRPRSKDGLRRDCKVCLRARVAVWQAANIERKRAAALARYRAEPELRRAESRAWTAANPEHKRATNRAWAAANPERVNAANHRYRARKLDAFVENVTLSFLKERDSGICGICQEPVTDAERASIDHIIPLARGGEHSRQNTQYAHLSCNSRKGARTDEAA